MCPVLCQHTLFLVLLNGDFSPMKESCVLCSGLTEGGELGSCHFVDFC